MRVIAGESNSFRPSHVQPAVEAQQPPSSLLFGRTPAMQEIKRRIELVAHIDVPVLIQGETGTGKDLFARLIHVNSSRASKPLVRVSCPAIPGTLLESELFGYEKGAFTGAHSAKLGRLEQAHLGTLVLDEIGSLDALVQSKLLQVLQDGTFMRVGGSEMRSISARVISIASEDLRSRVKDGSFRLDLLYRINTVLLDLPPLRERMADLPDLIEYFTEQHAKSFDVPIRPICKDILALMHAYDWPGNIRELDNLLRSYTLLGNEEELVTMLTPRPRHLQQLVAEIDIRQPCSLKQIAKEATRDLERQIILRVLQANGWNRRKTAGWLSISYRSLFYKLQQGNVGDDPSLTALLPEPSPKTEEEELDSPSSMLQPEFDTTIPSVGSY
ncbi:sigma-54 interaction domain-containing protein [Granulicella arctica]|uniref:Two-component system response regulator AtoC n=1 Tax=Granulicella arctica TaxID=940613 RepID=A0A7Y9TLA5_9BACT|nr:sigma-54 dependent transcriptional regulator [Granulicella arctica]NYF79932.1 two-component system response regulator AtoC [Granulicella arctica]